MKRLPRQKHHERNEDRQEVFNVECRISHNLIYQKHEVIPADAREDTDPPLDVRIYHIGRKDTCQVRLQLPVLYIDAAQISVVLFRHEKEIQVVLL